MCSRNLDYPQILTAIIQISIHVPSQLTGVSSAFYTLPQRDALTIRPHDHAVASMLEDRRTYRSPFPPGVRYEALSGSAMSYTYYATNCMSFERLHLEQSTFGHGQQL